MTATKLTYDIHFNDENDSNNKGFQYSLEDAKGYIKSYNGTNESYFEDYKGGSVSIVCNETGEMVYEEEILESKVGAKIAAIRKDMGLLQKELAEKTGTSQIHISRIEKGISSPSFEIITKIAEALCCKTDDFLG